MLACRRRWWKGRSVRVTIAIRNSVIIIEVRQLFRSGCIPWAGRQHFPLRRRHTPIELPRPILVRIGRSIYHRYGGGNLTAERSSRPNNADTANNGSGYTTPRACCRYSLGVIPKVELKRREKCEGSRNPFCRATTAIALPNRARRIALPKQTGCDR